MTDALAHRWYARPVFVVADLTRSLAFYVEALGFTKAWHEADGAGTVCQVNRSDCEIILSAEPSGVGAADARRSRLFVELMPAGMTALRAELAARAVPHTIDHWGYEVIRVVDPDGHVLLFPIEAT